MIEWVVIKGPNESWDLWTESRHQVFRKVTENSHAAMLHFFSPTMPELAVKSFMVMYLYYLNILSVCISINIFLFVYLFSRYVFK